jgi:NAD(P)-dependent dehydrogenase (short-subunit alcohol dehydrogenase family)
MLLKNKVAIVTGGNSGIGKAIVLELAKQGANITVDYVSHPDAAEELERQVASLGDQAIGVDADVSRVADLERLIATAVKAFGPKNGLILASTTRRIIFSVEDLKFDLACSKVHREARPGDLVRRSIAELAADLFAQ